MSLNSFNQINCFESIDRASRSFKLYFSGIFSLSLALFVMTLELLKSLEIITNQCKWSPMNVGDVLQLVLANCLSRIN